jgi:diguanylate cyclase (GGDEF)-like protein
MLDNYGENFSVMRRKVDIINLLKSIEGSIANSLEVFSKTDRNDFLDAYVGSTKNILQISLIDEHNKVHISSDKYIIGKILSDSEFPPPGLMTVNGRQVYRTVVNTTLNDFDEDLRLLLVSYATAYEKHEYQLMRTASITALLALFFALFTSRAIYYSAIEQSRKEKERLEHLVKERTRAIEILSKTDALTGLWNRGYLEEMLEMEFKRAKRHNFDITIMFIDLDHFKQVNDNYGHMAGDEVLREVSSRIQGCLRETDFIGRYGGEELVAILPMTSLPTAKRVAEAILATISSKPVNFESHIIKVTTSIGMSSLRKEYHDHLMVFAEADEALYKAKELGRNRVEVYNVKKEEPEEG